MISSRLNKIYLNQNSFFRIHEVNDYIRLGHLQTVIFLPIRSCMGLFIMGIGVPWNQDDGSKVELRNEEILGKRKNCV